MINENKKIKKKGFTLVELLAVIVILAIILVIAVPKVMSIIEDAKKGTLESTAKMIASGAEKQKVQNTVLGNTEEITCDSVAKLNKLDYASCDITFEDNTAKVTIEGSGKFEGLSVCNGTKTIAEATNDKCTPPAKTLVAHIQELLEQEETLKNGLVQTTAEYDGTTYDAGIRYVGAMSDVKNKVYYNCEDTDANGVSYGADNYDYANSCEVWRIIGVFDTKSSESGAAEKRIKLINTASTFKASWDIGDETVNSGLGINQWGESTYSDGSLYEGADLMRLLNGYYISKPDATCTYYGNDDDYNIIGLNCDNESLKSVNMKPLTTYAKRMIENAVWDTYAVNMPDDWKTNSSWAPTAYLEEKGISAQYTGKSLCSNTTYCNDEVVRTTSWTGLVGLMSVSDITYADGWLYDDTYYPFAFTPHYSSQVWFSADSGVADDELRKSNLGVWPSVYLKSNIKIIGGNGNDKPYILAM